MTGGVPMPEEESTASSTAFMLSLRYIAAVSWTDSSFIRAPKYFDAASRYIRAEPVQAQESASV